LQSRFSVHAPSFLFRAEMKKTGTVFDQKPGESNEVLYQGFCFFQKFKFIHFTEALEIFFYIFCNKFSTGNFRLIFSMKSALEIFFNFLSMTITVFDVLNNELHRNKVENYKIAISIHKYFPGFCTFLVFSPPPLFSFQTPFDMNRQIVISRALTSSTLVSQQKMTNMSFYKSSYAEFII
jgi:hypothetical protein